MLQGWNQMGVVAICFKESAELNLHPGLSERLD